VPKLWRETIALANTTISADVTLSQKLGEELEYEKQAAPPAEPDFLKSFKANGVWTVSLSLSFTTIKTHLSWDRLRTVLAMTKLL